MITNIFKTKESDINSTKRRNIKEIIDYYSIDSDNANKKVENSKNSIAYRYNQLEQEVGQVLRERSITWQTKEQEYLETIKTYKVIIGELTGKLEETEGRLQQVLQQEHKYCDYTKLVLKEGELNTKRTYEIRQSTAKLFKQVKRASCGINGDITLNEMADTAIQIYCQMFIKQLQDRDSV
ncbi:hypothetical protein [Clostridium sp. C8-1-8]|uniref:hypothetical protein n=1 Tax=Clostridium sp. C8-1-8 TaxID=2698831 RepID=UPI0013685DD4|nr:hypothetical protein [Clostridium sp. C8-1-8]